MALKGYFYNAMKVNGEYDRKYNADDYSDNLAAIISDGVRRSGADDFKVSASGLTLTVKRGYAMIGGKAIVLDADYTFSAIAPPVGSFSRIDAVVLRQNTTESVRAPSLLIVTGTASSTPVAPSPTRSGGIYDIVLAHVLVEPLASTCTVTDKRPDSTVCGWITTPVGYDEYFASLDSAFQDWFAEKKDQLASTTLFKSYMWRTVLDASASAVSFNIPQYDSTGVDIIQVYVNGLLQIEGVDYTISGSVITFGIGGGGTGTKIAGTEIVVICYKSIDGKGLGSVSDEVTELQSAVDAISGDSEYVYVCNGLNDNVKLSEIAQAWFSGGSDYACKRVRVIGTFGMSAPYAGSGTNASPYRWVSVGTESSQNRKIIFDFSCCSQITVPIQSGTENYIFYGADAHIIGANVVVNESGEGTIVKVFSSSAGAVTADDCRFWITSYQDSTIANTGTFTNCRGSVANVINNSYCFLPYSSAMLRINGGEYYAYTGDSSKKSAIVGQSGANAVSILYGVSAPTSARTGYYQTNSILQFAGGGVINCTDLVSALSSSVISGISNIIGTIAISKPGTV